MDLLLEKPRYSKRVTIKGIIVPMDWDENGDPLEFGLHTHDEENIIIAKSFNNKKLKKLLNKQVKISGIINYFYYGDKTLQPIKVSRYDQENSNLNNCHFSSGPSNSPFKFPKKNQSLSRAV